MSKHFVVRMFESKDVNGLSRRGKGQFSSDEVFEEKYKWTWSSENLTEYSFKV